VQNKPSLLLKGITKAAAGRLVPKEWIQERNLREWIRQGVVEVGALTFGLRHVQLWDNGEPLPKLRVGAYCSIADDVRFLVDQDHHTEFITTFPLSGFPASNPMMSDPSFQFHPRTTGPIIVGNDVWIGERALILGGVEIGDGAVIAAGAVVTSCVEPYAIYGGVPGRLIRYRFEADVIERLAAIRWWEWDTDLVRKAAPLLLSSPDEIKLAELEQIGKQASTR
jgi:acetyltransferase-like isoleucine patch superfamily enzyme